MGQFTKVTYKPCFKWDIQHIITQGQFEVWVTYIFGIHLISFEIFLVSPEASTFDIILIKFIHNHTTFISKAIFLQAKIMMIRSGLLIMNNPVNTRRIVTGSGSKQNKQLWSKYLFSTSKNLKRIWMKTKIVL